LGLPGGFLGATVGLLGGLVIVSRKSPEISPRNPQKAREGNRFSKKKILTRKNVALATASTGESHKFVSL